MMNYIEYPTTFEKASWEKHQADLEQMDSSDPVVLHARKIAAYVLHVIGQGIIKPDLDWRNGDWDSRAWHGRHFEALVNLLQEISRREGYWRGHHEPDWLPWPEAETFNPVAIDYFLVRLDYLQQHVEKMGLRFRYMGFSNCRLCGCINGTEEYFWRGWGWPSGLRHYITEHHVRPSNDFLDFVSREYDRLKAGSKTV